MKWVLDPTVAISKTELAQLLVDMRAELVARIAADEEMNVPPASTVTALVERITRMLVRLGTAGTLSE
jgi:hypothetical protein